MQKITDNISLLVITVMLGVLILVASFVFLLLYSQKKLANEKNRLQEAEIEHQKQLLRSIIESQEAERIRIGRDLHDGVGSSLFNLRVTLEQLGKKAGPNHTSRQLVETTKPLIDHLIKEVRNISHNLSPEILTMQTLTEAIEELCYNIDGSSGLSVFLNNEAGAIPNSLNLTASLAIYRALEELFTNTIKHAQADHINIIMRTENGQSACTMSSCRARNPSWIPS
jgi:signal transduction histidine kinase